MNTETPNKISMALGQLECIKGHLGMINDSLSSKSLMTKTMQIEDAAMHIHYISNMYTTALDALVQALKEEKAELEERDLAMVEEARAADELDADELDDDDDEIEEQRLAARAKALEEMRATRVMIDAIDKACVRSIAKARAEAMVDAANAMVDAMTQLVEVEK